MLFRSCSGNDDIVVEHSGYLMLGQNGLYILPGTNVILKQKAEPESPIEGDIWFDLSSEPLGAYRRTNGQWATFNDVPVGYITGDYLTPSATATVEGTGISAASVTASTFKSKISATGIYTFTYNGSAWKYDGITVTLSAYGISVTGDRKSVV